MSSKKKKKRKIVRLLLMCMSICLLAVISASSASAATGLSVDYHSQNEIRAYLKEVLNRDYTVSYAQQTQLQGPDYRAGELTSKTQQNAVDILNAVRYVAGIPYDVQVRDTYSQMSQAGALVNAVNGIMSHYPKKPVNMDDVLYQLGAKGCRSSNLYLGSADFKESVLGWVSDENNISGTNPGHRRWCLNPAMKYTGFGKVGNQSAMYAFDRFGISTSYDGVAWPAQNQPLQLFNTNTQWSISFNRPVSAFDSNITLTRLSDGKKWYFSNEQSDGQFLVNNEGYGQPGCIIFKPDDVEKYMNGDIFHVVVKSGSYTVVEYDVNFFDLYPVEKMEMWQTSVSLEEGSSTNLFAYLWPDNCADSYVIWSVSDSSVVKVTDNNGVFKQGDGSLGRGIYLTGLKAGTAEITGSVGNGRMKVTCQVIVTKTKVDISKLDIRLEKASYVYTGNAIEPAVIINGLTEGKDYTVSYKYNTQAGISPRVTITGINEYKGTVSKSFTITKKKIDEDKVHVSYDATSSKLTVFTEELIEGRDYTVSSTVDMANGKMNVTVTGKGNYTGTCQKTIRFISPDWVSLSYSSTTYSGKEKKPVVMVSGMEEESQYTVEYKNNVNAGIASVVVRGLGEYSGTVTKTFQIKPLSIKAEDVSVTFGEKGQLQSVTVKALKYGTDYNYAVTFSSDGTISRVTVTGKGNYSGNVHITPPSLAKPKVITSDMVSLSASSYTYNGQSCEPTVYVTGLTKGNDYTVEYKGNVSAGTGTVTVKGIGKYTGTVVCFFSIARKSISEMEMKCNCDANTGRVEVSIPSLMENRDYTVTVSKSKTKITVSVSGVGNYTGSMVKTLDITSQQETGASPVLGGNTNTAADTSDTSLEDSGSGIRTETSVTAPVTKPSRTIITKLTTNKKHQIKVRWKKVKGSGYQIRYSTSKSFATSKYIMVKGSCNVTITLNKLKKGKTYYVKVRAYRIVDGKKVYGKYSAAKKIVC